MKHVFIVVALLISLPTWATGTSKKKHTPVMKAAASGQVQELKSLIAKKSNLNTKDKNGNTALFFAISNDHTEAAKILIEGGAELTNFNENGDSALVTAVSFNNTTLIELILKKKPALLNLINPDKQTPLMKAAEVGSVETVRLLVSAGADLKARDKFNRTAYDIAKESQNNESLEFLKPK
ncbi:hypothetical protein AZI86_04160 [Bdellovibrio bacteriovorus]|uniref:Uncharacterized protein n=1 Tax=Bdellovibrio bacteriovorus TaxID=959 RepID=A0A150WPB1_BDEBC|nr:ankyrin repeat domain-containing protein [Bdellovibrio bacteriovorus]KYG66260.1 hypothetical protein AZI86_04160 [Bdellovibrio bacteriovorus]